ncbi:hemerythrin domain-containing protein [Caenimonas terrae]|uniref:Hemerythrin domain-containing protein n=1 Tax=Caenimonas terrae TaxID=696074 RepID=A0ABW0NAV1_9BURK
MNQTVRVDSLISSPAASFEQPFDMLHACHERMQRMVALLQRLREHMRTHGADEQARDAARDVLRYFERAAPQHHQDEELHVFPPLLAKGDPATRELVGRLQQEHLQMEEHWVVARRVLDAVAAGRLHALAAADEAALDAFSGLYAGHIAAEEQVVYPAAVALLDAGAVQAMGKEMAQRRDAA